MNSLENNTIVLERKGPSLWITINREDKRNALNAEVLDGIRQAVIGAARDPDIRVLVLTGQGHKAFCAGADLKGGAAVFATERDDTSTDFGRLAREFRHIGIPSIARINGDCVAGGMALMSLCDLAVATEAARFGLPEAKVGVYPMQVMVYLRKLLLPRQVNELVLTGELISALKAQTMGLVNRVVAQQQLDGEVDRLIEQILALSPAALKKGQDAIHAMEGMSFEEALAFAESQIALMSTSSHAQEGMAAFNEKRPPQWAQRVKP